MEEETLDLRDLWKIIRRRKWIIISITVVFLILGLIMGFMMQKPEEINSNGDVYESTASILITNFSDEKGKSVKGQVELNQQLTNIYGTIANSATVAGKTIKDMKLNIKTDEFTNDINVIADANSQVIKIYYSGDKNNNQQKVLTAYVKNFIEEADKVYPQGKLKVLDEPSETQEISQDDFTKLITPVQQSGQQTTTTSKTTPKAKSKKLILAVALFLGLMVGFGAAFVVEYLDNTVKKREEAERILNQSAIEIIPYDKLRSGEVYKEAFRSLRTNLKQKGKENVFVITSPSGKDGRTSICLDLAKSFAVIGHKVLIIDADGRNPKAGSEFNLKSDFGLSDILMDSKYKFDNISRFKIDEENIYTLCWGNQKDNPSDLLDNGRLKNILEDIKNQFDYIIIDTPAFTKYSDAQIIARVSDDISVLALITEGNTNVDDIKRFKEIIELSQIKLSGLIWRKEGI
ncbi:polysaccharide biosynthesis tyrosine autokinase [Clostridium fermenticellae]|uniref:non-specific protein-tyrosine kinase n=1 Tax=Clostridium fermenticellae TaxID=2068654 RepID=A0A386H0V6_9CLOT|nr:polysaccharide biosynthesis tyrosine autokinase [Clostridium fermenticellae]AYD39327.1 polysaccharide biosynthesis tyrosine autokinase [Clostridium fermenticellae]